MHRELTGSSVHLAAYSRSVGGGTDIDVDLERAMQRLRTLATLGRAAREDAGVKVRQPLRLMICVVPTQGLLPKGAEGRGTSMRESRCTFRLETSRVS